MYAKFSANKRVSQLVVLEDLGLLLSLIEGRLMVHRLANMDEFVDPAMSKIRGCNAFAVELKGSSRHAVCAAVKRKLVILSWSNISFQEEKVFFRLLSSDCILVILSFFLVYLAVF